MTHTIKYEESDLKYHDARETVLLFTQDDSIVQYDTVIQQFGREEITRKVDEIMMDLPGLKKGWTLCILKIALTPNKQ